MASSSGNTKFFQLRKGSKEITGDRKMVRWDIEGYIGIKLNFRKNDLGVLPDKNRSVLHLYGRVNSPRVG